jgi:CRP-like cAMP-binding protein
MMTQVGEFTVQDLRRYPLFAALDEHRLEDVLHQHRQLTLPAHHHLLFQGDWGNGVFLIRSGIARISRLSAAGDEVVVALVGTGDLLGEMALVMEDRLRSADVVALTSMEVVKLRMEPLERAISEIPLFARGIAGLMAQRLASLGQRLILRSEDARTRVLHTLLELARLSNLSRDPLGLIPELPQRDLALIAGLARGTTSSILSELRRRGTLEETPQGLRFTTLEPLRRRNLLLE